MCGIVGGYWKEVPEIPIQDLITKANNELSSRGPDAEGYYTNNNFALGHKRLSILDTSAASNQPFFSEDKRFVLCFNGEIFNYKELRADLASKGHLFHSDGDTEVLLKLYLTYGKSCLEKLNGFFAFAIYDTERNSVFLARDRFGIKPLVYAVQDSLFCFASETKALIELGIQRELNYSALFSYLQLSYVPYPISMLKGVYKLQPGHFLEIKNLSQIEEKPEAQAYYQNSGNRNEQQKSAKNYIESRDQLRSLLEESVEKRLVSDVPLGTFLSGGIDSSVISSIAAKKLPNLKTFSIGYSDEPYFDETDYAKRVADKIGSEHRVFNLSNADLYDSLIDTLDYIDEPFADSSALAVNMLCQRTSEYVKVALSGDGADELFSGYNKHAAEYRLRNPQITDKLLPLLGIVNPLIPKSRNSRIGNLSRKMDKFLKGKNLSKQERYWLWASIQSEEEANYFIKEGPKVRQQRLSDEAFAYKKLKENYLRFIRKDGDLNDVLLADQHLVLPNDMLRKVDSMSMANSLEVRTPFLDHNLVEFVNQLPVEYKMNHNIRKRILQDAFKKDLPAELYNRPKKGFEVPLLKWFRTDLRSLIEDELLHPDFIEAHGIFNREAVRKLILKMKSNNPGDSAASIWALMVFQFWWKKYFGENNA